MVRWSGGGHVGRDPLTVAASIIGHGPIHLAVPGGGPVTVATTGSGPISLGVQGNGTDTPPIVATNVNRALTAAQWTTANPVLLDGQLGFERDTLQAKLGDGSTPWVDLSYVIASGGGAGAPVVSVNGRTGSVTGLAEASSLSFRHSQSLPSTSFTVNHNLGYRPAVTVTDTAGTVMNADIHYVDANSLTVTMLTPLACYVECS
jgi:hypothetical protein